MCLVDVTLRRYEGEGRMEKDLFRACVGMGPEDSNLRRLSRQVCPFPLAAQAPPKGAPL